IPLPKYSSPQISTETSPSDCLDENEKTRRFAAYLSIYNDPSTKASRDQNKIPGYKYHGRKKISYLQRHSLRRKYEKEILGHRYRWYAYQFTGKNAPQ